MPPNTKKTQPVVDTLTPPTTVATSATPSQVSTTATPSSFRVTVPETIPSTALTSNYSTQDVYNARADAEAAANVTAGINSSLDSLSGRVGATATPFSNPEQFLNTLLLNRPVTSAETQRDALLKRGADNAAGLGASINEAQDRATTEFGLPGLQESLAETRTSIAERMKRYREELRQFEVNAKERGVARAFVDDSKQKLTADATAELADLHIIEAAQQGNLTAAKDTIQGIIDNKRQAFEDENKAIEAEIARLEPQLDEQSKTRAAQLQIALDERKRNIETALANEKETRGYLAEAAANGADRGTLDAILKAKTPGEALNLASPFIGALDREAKRASIAASYASIANSNTDRLLKLAAAGDQSAVSELGFDPNNTPVEVDPVVKRQLEDSVSSTDTLIGLAGTYKKIIDDYGFTNTIAGDPKLLGEISTTRALMLAEYKKAQTLGTLDNGVLALMDQILGSSPTSANPFANATGRPAAQLSAQMETFINLLSTTKARDLSRLGINPTQVDFNLISPDDSAQIDAMFGGAAGSTSAGFDPASFFNTSK